MHKWLEYSSCASARLGRRWPLFTNALLTFFSSYLSLCVPCFLLSVKMNQLDFTDGRKERKAIMELFLSFFLSHSGSPSEPNTIIKKKKNKRLKRFDTWCGTTPHSPATFQPSGRQPVFGGWSEELAASAASSYTSLLWFRLPARVLACALYFIFHSQAAWCNISQRKPFGILIFLLLFF